MNDEWFVRGDISLCVCACVHDGEDIVAMVVVVVLPNNGTDVLMVMVDLVTSPLVSTQRLLVVPIKSDSIVSQTVFVTTSDLGPHISA